MEWAMVYGDYVARARANHRNGEVMVGWPGLVLTRTWSPGAGGTAGGGHERADAAKQPPPPPPPAAAKKYVPQFSNTWLV